MDEEDVAVLLRALGLKKYMKIFKKNEINGKKLNLCRKLELLKSIGVKKDIDAMLLLQKINNVSERIGNQKIYTNILVPRDSMIFMGLLG